jgi:hypothetical protein
MEWWTYAQTRYDAPLTLVYRGLDPNASYKVRVVYVGDPEDPKMRLLANGSIEIHPFRSKPAPMQLLEFDIPADATRGGELKLSWWTEPGKGGFDSSVDIAEVFLIRKCARQCVRLSCCLAPLCGAARPNRSASPSSRPRRQCASPPALFNLARTRSS